ncbi:MAG: LON peptidase substrate-binding domain-containing protein [Deltaproteobacteria bacterium]|nr:LON peptidase substrate-binding domain-containing protein [Deltaproteobacteria bacterium]
MADDPGEQLEAALGALPIFPLPGTVFFPHTLLPLHVFEPRYRQLTEQVLASHQHLAIVLVDPANHTTAPLHCARVAGLGRLVHHERLPDGRFHVLLQGVGRVAFDDEVPMGSLLYRRVRARLIDAGDDDDVHDEMATLRGCYAQLLDVHPECKDTLGDLPLRLSSPSVVADLVCAALLEDTAQRQQALEETALRRRLKLANDALATLLLRNLSGEAALLH